MVGAKKKAGKQKKTAGVVKKKKTSRTRKPEKMGA